MNFKYKNNITLNDLNELLSQFKQYFKFYHNGYHWTINKNIFKILFMNYDNRKYIDEFKKFYNNKYKTEYDIKLNFIIFLLTIEFIELDDIIKQNIKQKETWTLKKFLLN